MSHTVALVPIRSLQGGKTRLSGMFDPEQRSRLVLRMADRLIEVIARSGIANRIVILTSDANLRDLMARGIATALPDVPPGLNAAIDFGRRYALDLGAERLLVVFPDLPEVSESDLREIDRSHSPVTIIPDRQHEGTNALLLAGRQTLETFEFAYGPGSLALHQQAASRIGASAVVQAIPGMAIDLDTPADWQDLAPATRQWLLEPLALTRSPEVPLVALEHS